MRVEKNKDCFFFEAVFIFYIVSFSAFSNREKISCDSVN